MRSKSARAQRSSRRLSEQGPGTRALRASVAATSPTNGCVAEKRPRHAAGLGRVEVEVCEFERCRARRPRSHRTLEDVRVATVSRAARADPVVQAVNIGMLPQLI